MGRPLRDCDYFETVDEWIFCVIGDVHPPGRVFSFLKYIPGEGPWRFSEKSYVRLMKIYSVEELLATMNLIKESRPEYLFYDETVSETITAPPISMIRKAFHADEAVWRIMSNKNRSGLEEVAAGLLSFLSEHTDTPLTSFGITGSLLLGNPHGGSDIDLVVYGREEFWRVIELINEYSRSGEFKLLRDLGIDDWIQRASRKYPLLSLEDVRKLSRRVVNKGFFRGRKFSIYGVRNRPIHSYGEVIYKSRGSHRGVFRVKSSEESGFTPAIYMLEDNEHGVERLVTYDMMLACKFRPGDVVEASGKLEDAYRNGKLAWRQLLVGSFSGSGREYVKLLGPAD